MSKIFSDSKLEKVQGNKIVLVGGCFDILHPAHYKFLKKAKDQGDVLVVLLESDENIRKIKGANRPLNNQYTRAENLSTITEVDFIILLKLPDSSQYYYNLVNFIRPAIIAVTTGDPLIEVKRDQANQVGGKIIEVMERDTKHSTSQLIKKAL